MTRDEAIARHENAAVRDIPRSCACGDWQYVTRPARWILGRARRGCPWHLSPRACHMTIPMPRYTGAVIYVCPDCWGDLDHEGADHYWCRACQQSFYFTQVALYDAEGLDD